MESLTCEQRAEIDALIVTGGIVAALSLIMKMCRVGLAAAREVFKARYRELRAARSTEFACGDEEYWRNYGEDIFEAMAKGL